MPIYKVTATAKACFERLIEAPTLEDAKKEIGKMCWPNEINHDTPMSLSNIKIKKDNS